MIDRAVHSDVNFPISPDGCLTGGGRTDGPSGFTGPSGRARLCGWRGAGAQWPAGWFLLREDAVVDLGEEEKSTKPFTFLHFIKSF